MPWIRMRGVKGLVYEPESTASLDRKHRCPDCYSCQMRSLWKEKMSRHAESQEEETSDIESAPGLRETSMGREPLMTS